jgi:hypothetical protein
VRRLSIELDGNLRLPLFRRTGGGVSKNLIHRMIYSLGISLIGGKSVQQS